MTTTYELYTNENGTPKAVEGKAPAIIERVEALEESLGEGVVTSVNGATGDITPEQTGCLPLSGGTMINTISYAGNIFAKKTTNDSYIVFQGGSDWDNGAYLQLCGDEYSSNPSTFLIQSRLNGNVVSFVGKNDGTLAWNDKNIVRKVNDADANKNGWVDLKTLNSLESSNIDSPPAGKGLTVIAGSTTKGTPQNGTVLSVGGSSSWNGQVLISDNNSGLYFRGRNNNTWMSWYRMMSVPNYSGGVKMSEGGSAPRDGFVYVSAASNGGKCMLKLYVNGVEVALSSTYGDAQYTACCAFVEKDSKITTSRTSVKSYSMKFFPLKGA